MNNSESKETDISEETGATKKRGAIRGFLFGWLFPVDAIRKGAAYNTDKNKHGGVGTRLSFWKKLYASGFNKASHAIKEPETFDSIEELEQSWGVTDDTRPIQVKNLKRHRVLLTLVAVVACFALYDSKSAVTISMFVIRATISLAAILCLGTIISTVSWRIHVLTKRNPITYTEYIKGHR